MTQAISDKATPCKNLYKIINSAAGTTRAAAIERHSFIINEVSPGFQIATDGKILTGVLNHLISIIIDHSKHSCIRIKATEYDDIVFVSIKDTSSFMNSTIGTTLEQMTKLAQQLNGIVTIKNTDKKSNTVLLSFPNFPVLL